MIEDLRRATVRWGPDLALLGIGMVLLAVALAAHLYGGTANAAYSPLNHTVSALGEAGVSDLAALFNASLVGGGMLVGAYMVGIVVRAETAAGRGFGLLGGLAAMAMACVGLFPVDDLGPHVMAAAVTFSLVVASGIWFAAWVLRGPAPYPRWLGWFAVWIAVAMVAFFLLPRVLQPEYSFAMGFAADTPRPDLLLGSLLEWLAVGSAWLWIAALAWHDRARHTGGLA